MVSSIVLFFCFFFRIYVCCYRDRLAFPAFTGLYLVFFVLICKNLFIPFKIQMQILVNR